MLEEHSPFLCYYTQCRDGYDLLKVIPVFCTTCKEADAEL